MINDSGMERGVNVSGDVVDVTKRSLESVQSQTEFGDKSNAASAGPETERVSRAAKWAAAMIALAIALPGMTFLFARWWSVPLYVSNDDVAVEFLLRGVGVTGRATAYVLFMHVGL